MKSAYELAMERFAADQSETAYTLTDAQRAELEELDRRFKAKIAEREVFLAKQLKEARAAREGEAVAQLETQLRNERARLNDELERAKEKVRKAAS